MPRLLIDKSRCDVWPRSPDEVEREALQALRLEPHLRDEIITCRVHQGLLILRGEVVCYYHKQLAQCVVAGITGVRQVVNRLVVTDQTT
ncbi:MAG: BON domain-containing protein [Planctomycetaceae bacterium]